jgi:uncharacterized protein YjiS (DUF1127 family)
MSIINNTYTLSGGHHATRPWLSLIVSRLHQLGKVLEDRRIRAREMQDLYRCSDRELWDMGLSRSDLLSIEQGTFRRD